jgi:hypothetical protein
MSRRDFKVELKHLYRPSSRSFVIVDVPSMQFLMIDGHGDPNVAQEYRAALEALYAAAYRLKALSKNEEGRDYVVPPLEGLWWAEDMATFAARRDKSAWDWTMMIMQPEWITSEMLVRALKDVGTKKDLPSLPKIRLQTYHEGFAVQILHIGSYDDEGPTIDRMHTYAVEQGYEPAGLHHEIYLSDARRVAPEKLKTVLRQPIRKV